MIKVEITAEQFEYAKSLVEYSMTHHKVRNIWGESSYDLTFKNRLVGSLGEVVFADYYEHPRPTRSFGAIDGQDNGCDYKFADDIIIDLKTQMRANPANVRGHYCLNIPAYQLAKESLTTHYFCININKGYTEAVFIGYCPKSKVSQCATFVEQGTERHRQDGTTFNMSADTWELAMGDLDWPPMWRNVGEWITMC